MKTETYSSTPSKPIQVVLCVEGEADEVLICASAIEHVEDDYAQAIKQAAKATRRDGIGREVKLVQVLKSVAVQGKSNG